MIEVSGFQVILLLFMSVMEFSNTLGNQSSIVS